MNVRIKILINDIIKFFIFFSIRNNKCTFKTHFVLNVLLFNMIH